MIFKCEVGGCGFWTTMEPIDRRDASMERMIPSSQAPLVGQMPDGWTMQRTQLPTRVLPSSRPQNALTVRSSEIKLICPRHMIVIGPAEMITDVQWRHT